MFEGDDDDFSFIDEDFLKDALQPNDSRPLVSKNDGVLKVNDGKTVTDLDKNIASDSKPKFSTTDLRDASEKKCFNLKSRIVVDNVNNNSGIKSVVKKSDNICGKDVPVVDNTFSFEFDDFFDDIETQDNFDTLGVQNTPPDSEFTNSSGHRLCVQVQSVQNNLSLTSTNCNKKTDFRAKILQTLQENKHISDPQNKERISCSDSESSLSVNSFCVVKTERKRRASLEDLNTENGGSASKKIQIFPINQDCNSEEFRSQEPESEQEFQSCSSFITPLKPSPAIVRKSVSPGGPVIQKRKFPGPAGILPQLGSKTTVPNVQQLHEKEQSSFSKQDIVCSQSSADDFICGPWRQMSNDLELDQSHQTSPLVVFNIKWVLRRAGLRGQAGVRKIPFLAVMVRSIDATLLDATVILKDQTGEMSGTISSSVLEEYGHALQPGCVLLLRDVTLLSPVGLKAAVGGREPTRRHYLNITLNTILTIYSSDESGHVITTTVCKVDKKDLFKRAGALKTATAPRAIVEEEEEEVLNENLVQKQSLFSNINQSFGSSPLHSKQFIQSPNYRIPRTSAGTPPQPNSLHQHQRFRYQSPVNNNPRIANQSANFSPRVGTSNVNRLLRPQRFHTPSQQPTTAGTSSQGSFRAPVTQPVKVISSSINRTDSQTIHSDKSIFCSQEEEKEVSDLLDGVDTDSLFGDF